MGLNIHVLYSTDYALEASVDEKGIFFKSRDNICPAWLKHLAKSTVSWLSQKIPFSPRKKQAAKKCNSSR